VDRPTLSPLTNTEIAINLLCDKDIDDDVIKIIMNNVQIIIINKHSFCTYSMISVRVSKIMFAGVDASIGTDQPLITLSFVKKNWNLMIRHG
jgi:hypothetical protein